jgi:hypothetical protein
MLHLTGGCLCGRVRYTLDGEPAISCLCHCRLCQRYGGSAFETVMAYPADAVSVEGELKAFQNFGDSGQPVHRNFCPNCGSGIVSEVSVMPGLKIILAGTLDDPNAFQPTMDIYWNSAHQWLKAEGSRPCFAEMPTA